ncbi:ParB N-terminal domain-containing protein [Pseudonocardia spinosispora]|uniref:ParB N-terminal domain-containing protein n=1 Tax=Pseudonocardia spinosispora TaxID=103441 RepID=UPI000414CFB1|nr:ParB N-terminal domain-containing protein [Pseudonocardia spinosispora]
MVRAGVAQGMIRPPRFTTSSDARAHRWWGRRDPADPDAEAALSLDEVLTALGTRSGPCDRPGVQRIRQVIVSTRDVVGTVARPGDFDRAFRPMRPVLRERWEGVARHLTSGAAMPPVSLTRVGRLYFVLDGHHRISVARALGIDEVPAVVRAFCTTALADAGLTRADLDRKTREREFLRTVPLPDAATGQLRLDNLDDYHLLTSAARAWCVTNGLAAPDALHLTQAAAAAWWHFDVRPASNPRPAATYLTRKRTHI